MLVAYLFYPQQCIRLNLLPSIAPALPLSPLGTTSFFLDLHGCLFSVVFTSCFIV